MAGSLILSGCSDADAHNRDLYRAMNVCKEEVEHLASVAKFLRPTLIVGYYDENTPENLIRRLQALSCLLTELEAPDELLDQLRQTNRAQGIRIAEWSDYRLVWDITRRDGFTAVIGRRGIRRDVPVHYQYP